MPQDGKPVIDRGWLTHTHDEGSNPEILHDEAFHNVAQGIRKICEELRAKEPSASHPPDQTQDKGISSTPEENTSEEFLPVEQSALPTQITTPSLVVFLGSSSVYTALELMNHMLTLNSEDQRRVAFVYIDTDNTTAQLVEFRRKHPNVFQEFFLHFVVPIGIANAIMLDQGDGKKEQHTFIRGRIPRYFENPAGGIRNKGHIAACFHFQKLYDTLYQALTSIASFATGRELQAHVVSFLGGGTGSGI